MSICEDGMSLLFFLAASSRIIGGEDFDGAVFADQVDDVSLTFAFRPHPGRSKDRTVGCPQDRCGGVLDLKIGDKVLFGKYGGTEVKIDGKELLVMREEDVMAVIEGK